MNYKQIYDNLVKRAKERILIDTYTEKHHIVPRCIGGDDSEDNLVGFTPREHYLAHLLLVKIYPNVNGLWHAAHMMSTTKNKHGRSGNRVYEWVRKQVRLRMSTTVREKWAKKYGFDSYIEQVETIWSMFARDKMYTRVIAEKLNMPVGNVSRCIEFYVELYPHEGDTVKAVFFYQKSLISKRTRANITPEQEARRLEACKKADYSANNRRMSIARKGTGNPNYGNNTPKTKVTCPHCGFTGGSGITHRWHFDNCKHKVKIDES